MAASHPPCKDRTVCWAPSGAGKPAGDEMTGAGGKGRVAAGNQMMLFVVTPANSHAVLVAAG